jgi:hypothetical protein
LLLLALLLLLLLVLPLLLLRGRALRCPLLSLATWSGSSEQSR